MEIKTLAGLAGLLLLSEDSREFKMGAFLGKVLQVIPNNSTK